MTIRRQIPRTLVAWALLAAFMTLFRPGNLPVVVLIVPFILLFMAFYTSWNLGGQLRSRYFARSNERMPNKRLGMAVCLSAVLLIVLQSLGQLTLRDVVTLAAIVVLGYLYLARNRLSPPKR